MGPRQGKSTPAAEERQHALLVDLVAHREVVVPVRDVQRLAVGHQHREFTRIARDIVLRPDGDQSWAFDLPDLVL